MLLTLCVAGGGLSPSFAVQDHLGYLFSLSVVHLYVFFSFAKCLFHLNVYCFKLNLLT